MNDIEKLKIEFAEKLADAELENKLEEKLNKFGTGCRVSFFMKRDGLKYGSIRDVRSVAEKLTLQQAAACLCIFPADSPVSVYINSREGYRELPYGIETISGYNESPKLHIEWVHDGIKLHLELNMPAELQDLWDVTYREISSIERSVYCNGRGARWRDIRIPVYRFKDAGAAQTRFEGGHVRLWDEGLIYAIIYRIMGYWKQG